MTGKDAKIMLDAKWIPGLHPETPLDKAAKRALAARLEVIHHFLPLAIDKSDDDPEYVHQLRVGTRRAAAAIDILAACLPSKTYKKARTQVRRLRQAAGEARDWDVLLLELLQRESAADARRRAGLDVLLGYARGQRVAAQNGLGDSIAGGPASFAEFITETVAAVHKPKSGPETLGELAGPLLKKLNQRFADAAERDLRDYEQLHQVRIEGKRLRYAMEIVADCFPPAFRDELVPAIEEMQDILGFANDSHVAVGRLEKVLRWLRRQAHDVRQRLRPGIEQALKSHRSRLARERRQFLQWRQRWQAGGAKKLSALLCDVEPSSS
jgi:CHAD domain-containing protein